MELNLEELHADLEALAGTSKLKLKQNRTLTVACRVTLYDKGGKSGFDVEINPKRIRSEKKWQEIKQFAVESLMN